MTQNISTETPFCAVFCGSLLMLSFTSSLILQVANPHCRYSSWCAQVLENRYRKFVIILGRGTETGVAAGVGKKTAAAS